MFPHDYWHDLWTAGRDYGQICKTQGSLGTLEQADPLRKNQRILASRCETHLTESEKWQNIHPHRASTIQPPHDPSYHFSARSIIAIITVHNFYDIYDWLAAFWFTKFICASSWMNPTFSISCSTAPSICKQPGTNPQTAVLPRSASAPVVGSPNQSIGNPDCTAQPGTRIMNWGLTYLTYGYIRYQTREIEAFPVANSTAQCDSCDSCDSHLHLPLGSFRAQTGIANNISNLVGEVAPGGQNGQRSIQGLPNRPKMPKTLVNDIQGSGCQFIMWSCVGVLERPNFCA